jgi:nicotinate-nucleotide pyrophosphorylase (carboxylating)
LGNDIKSQDEFDLAARIENCREVLPESLQHATVMTLIEISMAEDLTPDGFGELGKPPHLNDITSAATLPHDGRLTGNILTKEPGVICGLPIAEAVFTFIDPNCEFQQEVAEGVQTERNQVLATVKGSGPALLAAERTALNFLRRLSGIATLTRKFVDAVANTGAVILDTRKTVPGYRLLDKYAVQMGGGENHRMGLYDMVLIKNNHIDSAVGIDAAVGRVRQRYGDRYPIEVEVRTLVELETALSLHPTRIMLDNMDLNMMRRAVSVTHGRVPLEASGNVNLATVRKIAETGVDYISVGSLTHSAPVLDISMHVNLN